MRGDLGETKRIAMRVREMGETALGLTARMRVLKPSLTGNGMGWEIFLIWPNSKKTDTAISQTKPVNGLD